MTIRNILVPVAGAKSDQSTLETALLVARRFDGHLDALHVRVDPMRQLPLADETMIPQRLQELENIQKNIENRARAARAAFDVWLADNQVPLCEDPPAAGAPSGSWGDVTGVEAEEVARDPACTT